jgi:hypothetical protein
MQEHFSPRMGDDALLLLKILLLHFSRARGGQPDYATGARLYL